MRNDKLLNVEKAIFNELDYLRREKAKYEKKRSNTLLVPMYLSLNKKISSIDKRIEILQEARIGLVEVINKL